MRIKFRFDLTISFIEKTHSVSFFEKLMDIQAAKTLIPYKTEENKFL